MTDHELVASLLARAGAIMEDASVLAVSALPRGKDELDAVIRQLERASDSVSALVHAAKALIEYF